MPIPAYVRARKDPGHRSTLTGGLFLLAIALSSCSARPGEAPSAAASRNEVHIGVAESGSDSQDVGLAEVWRSFAYEGLTLQGADGRPQPRLAASWSSSGNGLIWTIALRPGAVWHDGAPFTASSAVAALRTAVANQRGSAVRPGLHDIQSIEASGNDTLVLRVSQPSGFIIDDMDIRLQRESEGGIPLGTGPYVPESVSATEARMHAHPKYHEGVPQVSSLVITSHPTVRQAWADLMRGELDALWNVSNESVEFLNDRTIDTRSFPRRYVYVMAFNAAKPQFRNPVVRRALNSAIDRAKLIASSLGGHGRPAWSPVWPDHWAYDTQAGAFSYEPSLAVAALSSTGHPPGAAAKRLKFTCLVPSGYSAVERLALGVQQSLHDVGVDVTFVSLRLADVESRMAKGDFDAVMLDLLSGPSLSRVYSFWRSPGAHRGLNVFGYSDPDVDAALDKLRHSQNDTTVRAAVSQLQRGFERNPPGIFLAWSERSRALSRRIEVPSVPGRDPFQPYWSWRIRPASSVSQTNP